MAELDKNIQSGVISMFKMFVNLKGIVNVMRIKWKVVFFFKEQVGSFRNKK